MLRVGAFTYKLHMSRHIVRHFAYQNALQFTGHPGSRVGVMTIVLARATQPAQRFSWIDSPHTETQEPASTHRYRHAGLNLDQGTLASLELDEL